jgi:hypothetical protein
MNRHQRRAAAHERLRRRLRADRIPAERIPRQRERERALLRRVDGLPCPTPANDYVILLAEDLEPLSVLWADVPALMILLGLELHKDTIAAIERIRTTGGVPAITHIDGWLNVHAKRVVVMSLGGAA